MSGHCELLGAPSCSIELRLPYHCSVLERGPEGPLYTEEQNAAPM